MIPPTTDTQKWPESSGEQHWHRSSIFMSNSATGADPGDQQAPLTPGYLPPGTLPQESVFPLAYEYPNDAHIPRARLSGHHRNLNERFSQPDLPHIARSSGTFFDAPRVSPNFGNFNQNIHHKNSVPHLRSAQWEDNPHPASSWHDPQPRAYFHQNDYLYLPQPRHQYIPPYTPNYTDNFHPTHVAFQTASQLQPHCTHYCPSCLSGRFSNLTYVGPPICHNCANRNQQKNGGSVQQRGLAPVEGTGREDDRQENSHSISQTGRTTNMGFVRRWLKKYLPMVKPVTQSSPKMSKNNFVEPQPTKAKRFKVRITDLRRGSSTSDPKSTSHSSETKTASETVVLSTPSSHPVLNSSLSENSHPLRGSSQAPSAAVQPIPRPASTISTCQCIPTNADLHPILRHNPFAKSTIYYNVTLAPGSIYEPDLKKGFLKDFATNPPVRHMFINGIGDFPLEKCQGDPDMARSKNRERHMYPTGNGDERVEKRTLPWPMRISGTGSNGFITLEDVFRAIHHNFQQYIPLEEYELYTINRKRVVTAAYHLRQKALEETRSWPLIPIPGYVRPVFAEDRIEPGIMRCDYLGSQIMFRGLEISPDEEGYTLFLGPID